MYYLGLATVQLPNRFGGLQNRTDIVGLCITETVFEPLDSIGKLNFGYTEMVGRCG